MAIIRRSLRGNVDRNFKRHYGMEKRYRRSLRGNVDRNSRIGCKIDVPKVSFPTWERG